MGRVGPPVELVADDPNLTFVLFIALVLLAVLGLRFGFYAWRNRAETEIAGQRQIWTHMLYIAVFAALYGLAGILEIVSTLDLAVKSGLMLAMVLALAFTIRQVHHTANGTGTGVDPFERGARAVFVGVVLVEALLVFVDGASAVSATLQGLAALAFVGYGTAFYYEQTSNSRLRGTMLDSLLRHLLPVLTFAAAVAVVALGIPMGLDRAIVRHVQVVFIIMTATALMTATIKLRQNLAGL